jgi:tRNA threonylcarbamoyladenosine biosynthesis protein TsaB
MRILAVDTATETCSVAVVEGGAPVAELSRNHGQTHSVHLMPMIDSVLRSCRLGIDDMDVLAATVGPGSFTGLRIGLSTVKGLAFAAGKPTAGICSLDALASPLSLVSCRICAMIDARKNEVYAAEYLPENGRLAQLLEVRVLPPDQAVRRSAGPCVYVGSGARLYRDRIRALAGRDALFAPAPLMQVRAATVGLLAWEAVSAGRQIPCSDLLPWYVRASDAERALAGRSSSAYSSRPLNNC